MKTHYLIGLLLCSLTLFATAQTSVNTAPLSDLAVYPERFAPATVISLNVPLSSAQITAQILEVPIRVGDMVQSGQVLAKLDCSDYLLGQESAAATLENAEVQYALAQKNLERAQSLVADQLVSVETLDSSLANLQAVEASMRSANANLKLNQLNVSRCEILAPFDALVVERIASVGQLAVPGTNIARLVDLNSLEISAQVFSSDANQLSETLSLAFEANDQHYPVQLNSVLAALDSSTRNREVRLSFTDNSALPGSSGRIIWQDPRPHLPANYFVERSGQLGFFTIENNTAEFHPVEAAQPGRMNPVDISLDMQIITEGHSGLSNGDSLVIKVAE